MNYQNRYFKKYLIIGVRLYTQERLSGLQVSAASMSVSEPQDFARWLPLPRGFDGTRPELWTEFAFILKACMSVPEHDFSTHMDTAEISLHAITDEWQTLEHQADIVPD